MHDISADDMEPWLSPEELAFVRTKVPILYVDIVPVRLDDNGHLAAVGLLLCANDSGLVRTIVSGRVLFHESIHAAIIRNIEHDLGDMALPQLPASLIPFTVGEYFPTPGETLVDERQHAVSLGYVVPIAGDAEAVSDAVEFSWFTLGELNTAELQAEIASSHAVILKRALAYLNAC
ncbi:Uncharacterised protein [Chlamydia trachomatis]|nr:Uncharacterised protein [Chlamydia trachomatis]